MNFLYTFGCSYTDSFENNILLENYKNYKEFRCGNFPKTWNQILADKLNLSLINYGKGGAGNDFIFQSFCSQLDEYNENDIIIVQWSYITRFKWLNHIKNYDNKWGHNIIPANENYPKYFETNLSPINLSMKLSEFINMERMNKIYLDDVLNYEKIMNEISDYKKFKLYFWYGDFSDNNKIFFNQSKYSERRIGKSFTENDKTIFDEIYKKGGQNINMETNGIIYDNHMGESGHYVLCDIIYEHIIN